MMAEDTFAEGQPQKNIQNKLDELEGGGREMTARLSLVVGLIAAAWSFFQLWIASPLPFLFRWGIIDGVSARGVHLAFALLLCFLVYPFTKRRTRVTRGRPGLSSVDLILALLACACAMYVSVFRAELDDRPGRLLEFAWSVFGYDFTFPFEAVLAWTGIVLLLEATRRGIGLPLVVVAILFLLYSMWGRSMPDLLSHKGIAFSRLGQYQWLDLEAIFGIPISVTTAFVFLFVLFGAILDKAGAGTYFLKMSFALVGRFRGGPAKAAILASGMTGLISGSSIANTVTTGTFTIPIMRRIGMPAEKAGAIEVAASVNGQIMPPIMGAAAFIIAEIVGITYFEVVVAAFIPATISYIALLYISHLEALKLGLKRMPKEMIPPLGKTFLSGAHFLIPVAMLVYFLMIERWTPESSVFYAILFMMATILLQKVVLSVRSRGQLPMASALRAGLRDIYDGLVAGGRNMIGVGVATGTAGIIVGAVAATGLNSALAGIVEAVSGGNVYILLALTAGLCIVLGMGLPTTANYLVVASLLAGVIVEVGSAAGLVLPLLAVHLFVFYFGLMADVTPPVALAAFAASAISGGDPMKTGFQAFKYHIRTAVLPFVFIFNTGLLLIGVDSFWQGLMVFVISLLAILAFSSLTLNWMFVKNRLWENVVLAVVTLALFRPGVILDLVYPEFEPVVLQDFVEGRFMQEPGRTVRFHMTVHTDYGERFRLYRLETPQTSADTPMATYGVRLIPAKDPQYAGNFELVDVAVMGVLEKAGLDWRGDPTYVTEIDVEQLNRPAKEWIYPLALILLGGVVFSQLRRGRRKGATEPSTAGQVGCWMRFLKPKKSRKGESLQSGNGQAETPKPGVG